MADQTFAVHCGFFDAINSDRTYSADEMNRPYKRVISNGVFATPNGTPSTDLQVTASSGMSIICKKGEGLFGDKWFENPSGIAITVPSNTGTVPRIDSVLVQVDTRTSGRVGNIVHRTGTPASTPVPPAINQTDGVVEYRLANIRVNAGVSAITGSMITDRRGSSDCPWVTSLIYQVDTSTLYDQWAAAYAEYFEEEKAIWDAWYAQLTEDLDVSMTLDRHVNTVTTDAQTTGTIPIGLAYNHNTDILEVYINGLRAIEGTHYVVVNDDTAIMVENQLDIGQAVTFVVMRSVISGSATNIMVLLQELESQIAGIAGGTPTVVDSTSDMTEHDKIYILSSDSKWYYYSATQEDWVIGGTYGGVPTDTTLSISGSAADAKAVGDALAEKADSDDVTALDTRVADVEGALEDKADADDVEGAIGEANERLDDVKSAISDLGGYISEQVYFNENVYDGVCDNIPYLTSTGQPSTENLRYISASNLIPVNAGDVVSFESLPTNFSNLYCLFYFADKSYSTYSALTSASPNCTVPQNIKYFRFEFAFLNDTPASDAERWIVYINKTQTTKARITEINAHLDKTDADIDSIMANGDTYTSLAKISTADGKKAYLYNGALVVSSGSGYSCNVYEVKKGNKYKVYGFGYDRSSFYIACIGATDIITDGSASTEFLGNIECGTDEYPSGYTYHTVVFTATQNGYLYVNYQTAGDEAALSVADKVVKIPDEISNLYTDHGVYIADGNYYYFKRDGESYIIRKFNRRGPNNLFQWTGLYIGDVDGGIQITSTIAEYTTDIVGPISIFNTTLWPGVYGMWSGGNHDVIVNSSHYATAEQDDFACMVNGKAVSANGLYYGDVEFATKNKLYFPQSITGADLSTATLALNEYRFYRLSDQMDVRVRLEFMADARVTTYYGMQCVTTGFTDFLLANNEYYGEFSDLENEMAFAKQERKIYMTGNGLHFDMELRPLGLGNYERNDGQSESLGYFYLPKQVGTGAVHKAYFVCIRNANQVALTNGTNCVWEGRYSVYH